MIPTEHEECITLVNYLDLKGYKYTHIPNETFTKSWSQKRKNKEAGVKKGVPDYLIILPVGLLFIEMKRKKGSTTSQEQHEWIEALNKLNGVEAVICKGADMAIEYIEKITQAQ